MGSPGMELGSYCLAHGMLWKKSKFAFPATSVAILQQEFLFCHQYENVYFMLVSTDCVNALSYQFMKFSAVSCQS